MLSYTHATRITIIALIAYAALYGSLLLSSL